ncbi:hypothetical protein AWH56_011450 [Anaerobacillus isosaccharinicus]|uniref:Uncharacterized protein n=1 Tax=Anaerobacillus isosaccharinicus TaxID=1532552 RepID=A0A7S7LBP8_9BACI
MLRLLLSKNAIWIYSLIIFGVIGLALDIATIGAEEYALFENNNIDAANYASFLRNINTFYFPVVILIHFVVLFIFSFKYFKRSM